tara:strand:+ start:1005 stop:1529 length:525 start_codon:yes stop_codon:yes gene_type:complete
MATVYEIIQGLSQAAANAYDGALGEDMSPAPTGVLRREEGDALIDHRVMDGFNVKFIGNMMCLSYHSEVQLKEVYAQGFEAEIDQRLTDIAGWLKKEYKKVTGNSVSLTEEGEVDVMVQNSSRVRSWVQAKKHYKVGGLETESNVDNKAEAKTLEEGWRNFMSDGGWKQKDGTN